MAQTRNSKALLLAFTVSLLKTSTLFSEPAKATVAVKPETSVITPSKFSVNTRYVDLMQIMQQTKSGLDAARSIEAKRNAYGQELNTKGKELEQKVAQYKAKAPTMSDAAREQTEKSLAREEREIKALAEEREQDLKIAMNKATEELWKEIEEIVRTMATQEGLDTVIDTMTGRVLYTAERVNYTQKVIVAMDQKHTASSTVTVANNQKTAAPTKAS
jgi:outer membrane protein